MPLPRYLELALYHPEWGYYARDGRRVGREGDFFTSVSVGPLFGRLLAHRAAREFHQLGCPPRWRILEFGANDGRLAADILGALAEIDPTAHAALEYGIFEPLPRMRGIQTAALELHGSKVCIAATTGCFAADPLPGLILGNEVLDALPFHWVTWRERCWREIRIAASPDGVLMPSDSFTPPADVLQWLEKATQGLELPDGWQCEVRTSWKDFLGTSLRCVESPAMVWMDYGYERSELIHPARREGTWRAYRAHRIEADPWNSPGHCDLTAHVDFTGVAEAARVLGARHTSMVSQGNWLTRLAVGELAAKEGIADPAWARQFQTLTHPAHLGTRFHVLECLWR